MASQLNFAIYFAGDAYSTSKKIMGRQAAGEAFLRGVARTWPAGPVSALAQHKAGVNDLAAQLRRDGFVGELRHSVLPNWGAALEAGALYYPAPMPRDFALSRAIMDPASFSMFGVTHTLSSHGAMDQVSDLLMPPFQSWDALICTSNAAKTFVVQLQDEMRAYWQQHIGASKFVDVQLPVIPLGIDVAAFLRTPEERKSARLALGLESDEVAFLFAGRLSFHAKANPAPQYQALEKAAKGRKIVCLEAGLHPNDVIREAFTEAQSALAPSVRFISVDGRNEAAYRHAWRGADVFVSLSDNIQETFGLTPVEAMAAGLPVIVSDWSGYKDTVRHGVDGFRIPTIAAPPGCGNSLAARFALGRDNYDYFIGRSSLATVVDPEASAEAFTRLADDEPMREKFGEAGRRRAVAEYDWTVVLARYSDLVAQLAEIRAPRVGGEPFAFPQRADPFHRFAHFPTSHMRGDWAVWARPGAAQRLRDLLSLAMANYAFAHDVLSEERLAALVAALPPNKIMRVSELLASVAQADGSGMRHLLWLWKFDIIGARPAGA